MMMRRMSHSESGEPALRLIDISADGMKVQTAVRIATIAPNPRRDSMEWIGPVLREAGSGSGRTGRGETGPEGRDHAGRGVKNARTKPELRQQRLSESQLRSMTLWQTNPEIVKDLV